MRVCADENVSPKLTALLCESLAFKGVTLETVDDYQARSIDDEVWVRRFAEMGGNVVLGADGKMTTRANEVVALNEAGLRVVILDAKFANASKHIQIAHLFFWWPRIVGQLQGSSEKCLKVPWGWSDATDAIKPFRLDVQRAYKQLKREKARAA